MSFIKSIGTLAAAAALTAAAVQLSAREEESSQILFSGETAFGRVWANLSLTGQRVEEPFVPMAVGVQNLASERVKLDRTSFWLSDLEGILYAMPTVREWRKGYGKITLDRRMVSAGGIPWQVWASAGRYASTNFFPDLNVSRGGTVQDVVTLPQGHGMADLLYFERPRTFGSGRPFFLAVHGDGWEEPIRLRLVLP